MERLKTVMEILAKMNFFQGQRAGRELWNDKPFEVQEEDLKNFKRDINTIRSYILEIVKELKQYRDAEEQGLLLRLPCKVGETVAIILMFPANGKFFISQAEVKEINIGKYHLRHDMQLKLEPIEKRGTSYKYYASDWGKYVFSSLAEAEQALAKMKEV